jgi:hypothetical protein
MTRYHLPVKTGNGVKSLSGHCIYSFGARLVVIRIIIPSTQGLPKVQFHDRPPPSGGQVGHEPCMVTDHVV